MRRLDVTAFNAGLVFCCIAGLALWLAFGQVDWKIVSVAAPVALVSIGVAGLVMARNPKP